MYLWLMLVCLTRRAGAVSPVMPAAGPHRRGRGHPAGGLPFRRMCVTYLTCSVMYQTARLPLCVCVETCSWAGSGSQVNQRGAGNETVEEEG